MPLLLGDLARNPQRMAGAVRLGGIAGEFLVHQIEAVFHRAGWYYHVNAAGTVALSQLCTPGSGVQRDGEVDVGAIFPLAVARLEAGLNQVSLL